MFVPKANTCLVQWPLMMITCGAMSTGGRVPPLRTYVPPPPPPPIAAGGGAVAGAETRPPPTVVAFSGQQQQQQQQQQQCAERTRPATSVSPRRMGLLEPGIAPTAMPTAPSAYSVVFRSVTWAAPGTRVAFANSGRIHPVQDASGNWTRPSDKPIITSRAGRFWPQPPLSPSGSSSSSDPAAAARPATALTPRAGPRGELQRHSRQRRHATKREAETVHLWEAAHARAGHHGRPDEHVLAMQRMRDLAAKPGEPAAY
jgi:hypothetical protein